MSVQSIHTAVSLKDAVISPSDKKVYKLIIYKKIDIDTLGVYLMMLLSGRVTSFTPVMQCCGNASMSELFDPDILCINCGSISRGEGNFCKNESFTASEQVFQLTGLKDLGDLKNLVKYISTPEIPKQENQTQSVENSEQEDLHLKPLINKMSKNIDKGEQMEEGANILKDVVDRKLDPFQPLPPDFKNLYEYSTAVEFKLGTKGSVTNLSEVTGSMVVIKKRMTKHEFCSSSASVTFKNGLTHL